MGLIPDRNHVYNMSTNLHLYEAYPEWFGDWHEPAVIFILLIALTLLIPYIYMEFFEDYVKQLVRKR